MSTTGGGRFRLTNPEALEWLNKHPWPGKCHVSVAKPDHRWPEATVHISGQNEPWPDAGAGNAEERNARTLAWARTLSLLAAPGETVYLTVRSPDGATAELAARDGQAAIRIAQDGPQGARALLRDAPPPALWHYDLQSFASADTGAVFAESAADALRLAMSFAPIHDERAHALEEMQRQRDEWVATEDEIMLVGPHARTRTRTEGERTPQGTTTLWLGHPQCGWTDSGLRVERADQGALLSATSGP